MFFLVQYLGQKGLALPAYVVLELCQGDYYLSCLVSRCFLFLFFSLFFFFFFLLFCFLGLFLCLDSLLSHGLLFFSVIVRICKLGWFEGSEMKDLVSQSSKFMSSVGHAPLGLRLLTMLVTEMNEMLPGATLSQHRKICTSFRDRCLLPVFQIALTAHRQVLDGNVQGSFLFFLFSSALFFLPFFLSFFLSFFSFFLPFFLMKSNRSTS